jgi:hypothetical protein
VRFEPTIPVFERAKTIHALDREATVIGSGQITERERISPICWTGSLVIPRTFLNVAVKGTRNERYIPMDKAYT